MKSDWYCEGDEIYREFRFETAEAAWNFVYHLRPMVLESGDSPRITIGSASVEVRFRLLETGLSKQIEELFEKGIKSKMEKNDDKNTTTVNEIKLYADGGSRGNPGPSASGFVLYDAQDRVLHQEGVYLGVTTNNQAEYQALKFGLEKVKSFQPKQVRIYMDSLLVINQLKGVFKVKNRDLWPVYEAIKKMLAGFDEVELTHVPRAMNQAADAEVNKCLDAATK